MTREEKILLAIEKGITCNPETGEVFGVKGNRIIRKSANGYIVISINNNCKKYNIQSHQFIWYWVYGKVVEQIDHINRDKSDNRICNLREVSNGQNQWNKKSNGYSMTKDGRYRSRIQVDKKVIHLGYFNTGQEAKQSYLEAKKKYHQI
jgi:hypothetical protein